MEINMVEIGKRISELRKTKRLKQQDLLELLGCGTIQMLSGWENGHTTPTLTYLAKIAKTLDTSLDYLVFGIKQDERGRNIGTYKDAIECIVSLKMSGLFGLDTNEYAGKCLHMQTYNRRLVTFHDEFNRLYMAFDVLGQDVFEQQLNKLKNKYRDLIDPDDTTLKSLK